MPMQYAMTPLEMLQAMVATLEREQRMTRAIDRCRVITESTEGTLDRLVRERHELVQLLKELGVKHDPYEDSLMGQFRWLLTPQLAAVANATKP